MKIMLIWPKGFDPIYVFPMSLGYLKSNLDAHGHEVRILDCALDRIDAGSRKISSTLNDFRPDIIGLSCLSFNFPESLRVFRQAKEILPHATTILGGAHATCYAQETLKHSEIDYLIAGESEITFPTFLAKMGKQASDLSNVHGLAWKGSNGTTVRNPVKLEQNLDLITIPDYAALRIEAYIQRGYGYNTPYKRNAPIWATRGCPYRCRFCSVSKLNGRKIRSHSVEYMVRWVSELYHRYNIRAFNLIDDGFTTNMNEAKEFCRAMIALGLPGLRFSTPTGIRAHRTDAELLGLMKEAGWEFLCVAPESGSPRTLKRMQKDLDLDSFPEKVAEIRRADLKVHGFFIIGYPGETLQDVNETRKLLRACRFNVVFISNFQPLPGTPIYDELVHAGKIPEGQLPGNYSDGERAYKPDDLQNFNFPLFVLKEYLWQALVQPQNIPYILRVVSPRMVVKKLWRNVLNLLRSSLERF